MNSTDYYNLRSFHPDEIGGGPRHLTGEEVDAWRVFVGGGHLTARQRHLITAIVIERQQQPTADPVPVTVNVNVDQPIYAPRRSWGTFAAVISVANLFGLILAGKLIERIAPMIDAYGVYLIVAGLIGSGSYLYLTLKDRLDDPFV